MAFPWGKRGRGQSFIEFALVLPVLLMTLLVIIELGRLFFSWLVLEQSARAGVRFAVTLEFDPSHCLSGHQNGGCLEPEEEKEARIHSIRDVVRRSAAVLDFKEDVHWDQARFLKTTICVSPRREGDSQRYLPPDPDIEFDPADCLDGDDPGGPGDFVSVTVDYNHPVIVPFFNSLWPQFHLNARREARAETFRSNIPVFVATPLPVNFGVPGTPTRTQTRQSPQPQVTTPVEPTLDPAVPTPDCSLIQIEGIYRDDNEVHFLVRNENLIFPNLTRSQFSWPARECEDLFHFSRMYFPYYGFHEYVYLNKNLYTSPVDSGPVTLYWPADARPLTDWAVRFTVKDDQPIFGNYGTVLTFEFPAWGTCQVSGNTEFPRITNTPSDTPIAGFSPTASMTYTPGGPTATRRVTRTRCSTATEPAAEITPTSTFTRLPTNTPTPTSTCTPHGGPGD
jgi:hypothetical protein